MMKVLQLGTIPKEEGGFGETGGVATHVWELYNELIKKDEIAPVIFADNLVNAFSPYRSKNNIQGFSFTMIIYTIILLRFDLKDIIKISRQYRYFGITRVLMMVIYYLNLCSVIKSYDPDIIHAHHLEFRFCVAEIIVKDSIPIVATTHSIHSLTHSTGNNRDQYHDLLENCYEKCNNIIFVSDKLKENFKQQFGEFGGRETVIYNPVKKTNREAIIKNGFSKDNTLLFVGGFSKRKGLFNAIDAFDAVGDSLQNTEFIVVGSDNKEKLKKHINNNNINDENINIEGRVDNIGEYYNKADLFVLPTESESFGLVFIEAMSYKTPVIGTTGVPEKVIPSEEVGYRINPNDANQLAECIQDGLQREWDYDKIQKHAESFDWESGIEEYISFYKEVLD